MFVRVQIFPFAAPEATSREVSVPLGRRLILPLTEPLIPKLALPFAFSEMFGVEVGVPPMRMSPSLSMII